VKIYQPNAEEHQQWVAGAQESKEAFAAKGENDELIKRGLELVYKYNPQN